MATKSREINDAFKKFYINLYTSESTATDKEIMSFLDKLNLPKLSSSQQEDLDSPISSQEILNAIKALPTGKSPGQDGFTAEFFKCYAEDLLPLFENMLTEAFEFGKLPPSLNQPFCLALEPLAAAIRKNLNIQGVKINESTHKLLLYADDILWLTSARSVPALLDVIKSFSRISGYKVNWSKSEALPLTSYCPKTLFQAGLFQWPTEGIKYLGILFPHQIDKIIEKNLDPLFNKMSLDTDRWSPLFLSLWGKVNVLKMNCIPRLNYLLQCLPIATPQKYFKGSTKFAKSFYGMANAQG